jgi:hypothetical protein
MSKFKSNLVYWIPTGLIALNWTFGGVSTLLRTPSSMEVFRVLGYPEYFAALLGAAQILGVVAILAPVPRVLREWAYAGLTFDASAAIFSLLAIGVPAWHPVIALAVVLTSYLAWKDRLTLAGTRVEAQAA